MPYHLATSQCVYYSIIRANIFLCYNRIMRITKYEHACLTIEVGSRILVIDPGVFSGSFKPTDTIDAIIITHEHSDHFDPEKIATIKSLNPNVAIFTTSKVAEQIEGAQIPTTKQKITVGSFTLEFFGNDHASIVDSVVPCDNFGVVVNDTLVYPGDSFELPPIRPQVLALPVSAPWMKVNEALEYLASTKPIKVFPTHNALLSQIGQDITYSWIRKGCDENNAEFIGLQPDEDLTV